MIEALMTVTAPFPVGDVAFVASWNIGIVAFVVGDIGIIGIIDLRIRAIVHAYGSRHWRGSTIRD